MFLYSYWIGLHFMLTSFDDFFETGNFSLNSYSVHCIYILAYHYRTKYPKIGGLFFVEGLKLISLGVHYKYILENILFYLPAAISASCSLIAFGRVNECAGTDPTPSESSGKADLA